MNDKESGIEGNIQSYAQLFESAIHEISEEIVGNTEIVLKLLVALLSEGHVLLEGVPGIAKTKIVVLLSRILGLSLSRVQCTPDLLPADITGLMLFRPDTGRFEVHKGPVYTHILIADEINRTPPKVQSALLEAMAERQVTIFGSSETLPFPFFVMATQNPIEQEGTYPLPEAQLDRFMFKLIMRPLGLDEEKEIIKKSMNSVSHRADMRPLFNEKSLTEAISAASKIYVDESIVDYIARITLSTRDGRHQAAASVQDLIRMGASPRASIALLKGAKALALIQGRGYVIPYDVKMIAPDILRHRIVVSFDAESRGVTADDVIEKILRELPSP